MSFITAAVIGAGGAIIGGMISGSASKSAANTQANAANAGTAAQLQMFNTVNDQNAPWRQAGQNALSPIMGGFGLGPESGGIPSGYFAHQFNANDLNSYLAPNYGFMLNQGLGAVKNAGNLQTGLLSGNVLKGINDYAQNYAGNAYQNAFSNYTTNQQNIFNRLSTIAGFGTSANQTVAPVASNTGLGVANTLGAAGQARASGTVGAANAISGGINNAASWYALSNIMNPGGNVTIGNPGGVTQIGDYGAS